MEKVNILSIEEKQSLIIVYSWSCFISNEMKHTFKFDRYWQNDANKITNNTIATITKHCKDTSRTSLAQ